MNPRLPSLFTVLWAGFGAVLLVRPDAAVVLGLLVLLPSRCVRSWPDALPLLLIGGTALLAATMSPQWRLGLLSAAGMFAIGIVFVLVYSRVDPQAMQALAWGLALSTAANAVLAGWQVLAAGAAQATGFSFHQNILAAWLLIGIGGVMASWQTVRSDWSRAVWALCCVAGVGALVLTGSRSGFLALLAWLAVWGALCTWRAGPKRAALALGGLLLLGAGAAALDHSLKGPPSKNLLVNSGFESGQYPWDLSAGAYVLRYPAPLSGTATPAGTSGVNLVNASPGWFPVLSYELAIPAQGGEAYALSFAARPLDEPIGRAFVRVEALGEGRAVVAKLGREGWAGGGEHLAGGRIELPTDDRGAWRRVAVPLPPLPAGTNGLRVMFVADGAATGEYGWVDAFQLERGREATSYVPGRNPGLSALLGPLVPRLLALDDPIAASGGRLAMWSFGLELAAARPVLGYGLGAEQWLVAPMARLHLANPLAHLHSFYLKLLVEGGSALLVSILMWLGLVALRLLRRARAGSSAAAAALGTLVALLVQSAFDPILSHWYVALGFWLVMCVGLTAPTPAEQWMRRSEEPTGG